MGRAEWDFWSDPGTVDAMPEERKTFAVGAQNRLAVLADMINLFEPGAEVVPGVEAVDTSGHTPGHMSYMVHGGRRSGVDRRRCDHPFCGVIRASALAQRV
jgi:glyoxylase-like metal-dependent hydrolase (beta-lactamase superfamily II)